MVVSSCSTPHHARHYLVDYVYNTERARRLEAISVDMALFTAEVIKECDRCGVQWSLENPSSSKLFRFEPLAVLASLPDARYVSFDICGLGEKSHADRLLHQCHLSGCTGEKMRWATPPRASAGRAQGWRLRARPLSGVGRRAILRRAS
eukprot:3138100-Pyramimonas_sp.AAC.1